MTEAKPATDEEVDELRGGLPDQPMLSPLLEVRRLASLIARIDAERARVKALTEALRLINNLTDSAHIRKLAGDVIAVHEEPANG